MDSRASPIHSAASARTRSVAPRLIRRSTSDTPMPTTVATIPYATAQPASISRPPLSRSPTPPTRAYRHRPANATAFTAMVSGSKISRPHG